SRRRIGWRLGNVTELTPSTQYHRQQNSCAGYDVRNVFNELTVSSSLPKDRMSNRTFLFILVSEDIELGGSFEQIASIVIKHVFLGSLEKPVPKQVQRHRQSFHLRRGTKAEVVACGFK